MTLGPPCVLKSLLDSMINQDVSVFLSLFFLGPGTSLHNSFE